jgi:hypothetical protein
MEAGEELEDAHISRVQFNSIPVPDPFLPAIGESGFIDEPRGFGDFLPGQGFSSSSSCSPGGAKPLPTTNQLEQGIAERLPAVSRNECGERLIHVS